MAPNPNPSRITGPTWQLWETTRDAIPGVLLGGIYANKRGYHNTVNANLSGWPGNYSIQLALDLNYGPRDKARAVDWTMSDAQMRLRTGYLRDSALNSNDHRLRGMREFYGTLNSSTVYGLTKSTETGPWYSSSSDSSHLWHIHGSIFTRFVDDWSTLAGIASVLSGESLANWHARQGGSGGGSGSGITAPSGSPALQVTSPITENSRVGQLQTALNQIGENLTVDNRYTQTVAAAVSRLQQAAGITADGIYGTQSQQALAAMLEDVMPITNTDLQNIASTVWGYRMPWTDTWVRDEWGLREDGWRAQTMHQSSYGHSRRGSEQSGRAVELGEAILAAVTGGGESQILQRIEAHHAEQLQAINETAVQAAAERAALLALVQQGQSGELAAEAVVDELARRLTVPTPAV